MRKGKLLMTSIALALAGVGAVSTLAGCGPKDDPSKPSDKGFAFSIALKSGKNQLRQGSTDQIVIYDNGLATAGRSYKYYSTDEELATIDETTGVVTVNDSGKTGEVSFYVKEANTINTAELIRPVQIVSKNIEDANGGFNFANASGKEAIEKREEILGKLEKYAMDSHLTGITLFDNGGYVRYSDRVHLPATEYITGYGFGLLTEGYLDGDLYKPGSTTERGSESAIYPSYLHSSISQDSIKINQYTATGSQVSDLASYITSTYWGTRLKGTSDYEWYPVLATDMIYPTEYKDGEVSVDTEAAKVSNDAPIPMEEANSLGMYKKWRIYVKTDGDVNGSVLKFHQLSPAGSDDDYSTVKGAHDGRAVTIEDYIWPYKMLLTGSSGVIRGSEMANDSSYGIKGAAKYFSDTKSMKNYADFNDKWEKSVSGGKLGINYGSDANGAYIDLELINAIDSFTAMYTLSSSLVSPLPMDMFVGPNAVKPNDFVNSCKNYGTFAGATDNNVIMNNTVSCGPFTLEKWVKNEQIVFKLNDDWFEKSATRYRIPGIYYRVYDTSENPDKNWDKFEEGNLDSAGVPSKKVATWKDKDGVWPTKGDSTFKLNVNSCTQEQWDKLDKKIWHNKESEKWDVKPWMSNSNFLDGLFYSIDRKEFADKRGVTPSINYFSDSYMSDPQNLLNKGGSYNLSDAHKQAVAGYETIDENGESDYGYNFNKALDCFRNAVKELSQPGKGIVLGTKENPTEIKIQIRWMYQTDEDEYGKDIASYFTKAFNHDSVCGGKVKLVVEQKAVTNWEDVYNLYMMKGRFDLGFGAISGNTFNPLNFLEVLKSDNSSEFTLNWGTDTSIVDPVNPIIYDEDGDGPIAAKEWSFDGLWEVADHGGILDKGAKVKPIEEVKIDYENFQREGDNVLDLYNGFDLNLPVEFFKFSGEGTNVTFDVEHIDCYVYGKSNFTLGEKDKGTLVYNKSTGKVTLSVDAETAKEINDAIKEANGFKDDDIKPGDEWKKNPFILNQYGNLFDLEVHYSINIGDTSSTSFITVSI